MRVSILLCMLIVVILAVEATAKDKDKGKKKKSSSSSSSSSSSGSGEKKNKQSKPLKQGKNVAIKGSNSKIQAQPIPMRPISNQQWINRPRPPAVVARPPQSISVSVSPPTTVAPRQPQHHASGFWATPNNDNNNNNNGESKSQRAPNSDIGSNNNKHNTAQDQKENDSGNSGQERSNSSYVNHISNQPSTRPGSTGESTSPPSSGETSSRPKEANDNSGHVISMTPSLPEPESFPGPIPVSNIYVDEPSNSETPRPNIVPVVVVGDSPSGGISRTPGTHPTPQPSTAVPPNPPEHPSVVVVSAPSAQSQPQEQSTDEKNAPSAGISRRPPSMGTSNDPIEIIGEVSPSGGISRSTVLNVMPPVKNHMTGVLTSEFVPLQPLGPVASQPVPMQAMHHKVAEPSVTVVQSAHQASAVHVDKFVEPVIQTHVTETLMPATATVAASPIKTECPPKVAVVATQSQASQSLPVSNVGKVSTVIHQSQAQKVSVVRPPNVRPVRPLRPIHRVPNVPHVYPSHSIHASTHHHAPQHHITYPHHHHNNFVHRQTWIQPHHPIHHAHPIHHHPKFHHGFHKHHMTHIHHKKHYLVHLGHHGHHLKRHHSIHLGHHGLHFNPEHQQPTAIPVAQSAPGIVPMPGPAWLYSQAGYIAGSCQPSDHLPFFGNRNDLYAHETRFEDLIDSVLPRQGFTTSELAELYLETEPESLISSLHLEEPKYTVKAGSTVPLNLETSIISHGHPTQILYPSIVKDTPIINDVQTQNTLLDI